MTFRDDDLAQVRKAISAESRRTPHLAEDIEEAAWWGLFDAKAKWRADGGSSWENYRYTRIHGAIADARRRSSHCVPLVGDMPEPHIDLDARLDGMERLRLLSRRDREIVVKFAAGTRASELADDYGITARRVYQILEEIQAA